MRVAGTSENIAIKRKGYDLSTPYKLPKQEYWRVSIKIEGTSKYRVVFIDLEEANRFRAGQTDDIVLIKLPVVDEDGIFVEEVFFHTKQVMAAYIKNMTEEDIRGIRVSAAEVEGKQTMVLEDFAKVDYGDIDSIVDDELAMQIAEFEEDYVEKSLKCKERAKNLLLSLAEYYLGQDYVQNNDYVKYKLVLEEHSLSTLIFQIDVSKKAIFELSKQVYIGTATTKQYDALATMQRIILDVNKYQSQLVKDIVDDFDKVKKRAAEIALEKPDENIEEGKGIVLNTSNRKQMMQKLKDIKLESDGLVTDENGVIIEENPTIIDIPVVEEVEAAQQESDDNIVDTDK